MIEFFKFATSGFWVFIGTVIIISIASDAITDILKTIIMVCKKKE